MKCGWSSPSVRTPGSFCSAELLQDPEQAKEHGPMNFFLFSYFLIKNVFPISNDLQVM